MLLERFEVVFGLAFQAYHRKNGYGVAQRSGVDVGMVGLDRPLSLERSQPALASWCGKASFGREIDIGYPPVSLQFGQKLQIYRIEVQIRHVRDISICIPSRRYNKIIAYCNCPLV